MWHGPHRQRRRLRIDIVMARGEARAARRVDEAIEDTAGDLRETRIAGAVDQMRTEHQLEVMRSIESEARVGHREFGQLIAGIAGGRFQRGDLRGVEQPKSFFGDGRHQRRLVGEVVVGRGQDDIF